MENLYKAGRAFYALCIIGLAIQQFFYADFRPVILPELPLWIHYAVIVYPASTALMVAGAWILFSKRPEKVALILGMAFLLLFLAFHVPYLLFVGQYSPRHFGVWTNALKELALAGGGFVIAGSFAEEKWRQFVPWGRVFFSITMITFGIDHFLYTDFVAALVPAWIPGQIFWTYFAAVALIGAGVAIILNIRLRLVALLLGTMLFLWFVLLHIPRAIAQPYTDNGNEVTSVFEALGFSGIAFVMARIVPGIVIRLIPS